MSRSLSCLRMQAAPRKNKREVKGIFKLFAEGTRGSSSGKIQVFSSGSSSSAEGSSFFGPEMRLILDRPTLVPISSFGIAPPNDGILAGGNVSVRGASFSRGNIFSGAVSGLARDGSGRERSFLWRNIGLGRVRPRLSSGDPGREIVLPIRGGSAFVSSKGV